MQRCGTLKGELPAQRTFSSVLIKVIKALLVSLLVVLAVLRIGQERGVAFSKGCGVEQKVLHLVTILTIPLHGIPSIKRIWHLQLADGRRT